MTYLTTAQQLDRVTRSERTYRLRNLLLQLWVCALAIALGTIAVFVFAQIILETARLCATAGNCLITPVTFKF